MKSFIEQAQFYAAYHQKPITRYTHFVGIPLIIFSLMVLFGFLHLVIPGVMDITLAGIATAVLLVYYFYLNWRLTLILTVVFIVLLWLANLVSQGGPTRSALWIFAVTFVLGWILQLVGHLFEGKRPAFMDNLCQALVAPLFITAELIFLTGYLQALKDQINEPQDITPEKIKIDSEF